MRRDLDEADRVKSDVTHALGYFRRQSELQQDERDACRAKVVRIEEEVATLQRKIKELEAEKGTLATDKATLTVRLPPLLACQPALAHANVGTRTRTRPRC